MTFYKTIKPPYKTKSLYDKTFEITTKNYFCKSEYRFKFVLKWILQSIYVFGENNLQLKSAFNTPELITWT